MIRASETLAQHTNYIAFDGIALTPRMSGWLGSVSLGGLEAVQGVFKAVKARDGKFAVPSGYRRVLRVRSAALNFEEKRKTVNANDRFPNELWSSG